MFCPACEHRLGPSANACDLCGFHLGKLDAIFGASDFVMDQITDTSQLLRFADREQVMAEIARFERQFPQFFPAFYIGVPPKETQLRVFATWLLNRARVSVEDEMRNNENAFLFLIDPLVGSMTVCSGYFAEQFVEEREFRQILEAAALEFSQKYLGNGMIKILRGLSQALRRRHTALAKQKG